ncbi:DUF4912 domain-containing protein [Paenibacillus tarimensis]
MTIIAQLLEAGKTQREVAEQMGVPIGKLKYQLAKHRKTVSARTRPESAGTEGPDEYEFDIIHEHYGADQLYALPRDDRSLYLYWELTPERIQMAEEHFHCGWNVLPKVLRIYDVSFIHFHGDNFNRYWEFEVNQDANNWFVKDVSPNCSYIVDYGTRTIDGRFFTILRSNTVTTPPSE